MSCGAVGGRHSIVTEKHSLTVKCPCGAYWEVVNTIKVAGCPRLQADGREKYFSLFRMRGARCVFFVWVFVRGGGSCSPPQKTGRGSCGLCYNKNVQRSHMTAGRGERDGKPLFFVPCLFFGELSDRISDTKNKARQPRFDRRAGICYNASVGLSVPPLRTEQ